MKINKTEALALAKILHSHIPSIIHEGFDAQTTTLLAIASRIDRFLLADVADADYVDKEYIPKKSSDKGCADPFRGESDDDENIEDEEKEKDDEINVVEACDLHDLKGASGKDGTIEFEYLDGTETVDLLVDGHAEMTAVSFIRRYAKKVEVQREDGRWIAFIVNKFPKGWASLLPIGVAVKVEA